MMVTSALFAVLSTRGGRDGTAGAARLTVLGVGSTVGMLAETITYRVFSPKTFDPAKAAIVSAAVVLSPLMAIIGERRLPSTRRTSWLSVPGTC
jgi:hypothetical protein